ncbi:MAG: hypothetical protein IMY67_01855 [Bacteroidetes bacterium]|nr:hypothetical protein [Bacteroidota bacterium]
MNFESIGQSLLEFDIEEIIFSHFNDKSVQDEIIKTLSNRLFKEGLKKNGNSISTDRGHPYTPFTERIKKETGSPINRVTLTGDGDLYDSMVGVVTKSQLSLVADFDNSKYNGGIFKNFQSSFANKKEFRETVMSLTVKEIDEIINNLRTEILKELKRGI